MKTFKAVCLITASTVCICFIPEIYQNSAPLAAALLVIVVSPLMMQIIARTFEGRWLWPPRGQFNAFIYGDTIVIPVVAACMAAIFQQWDDGKIVYEWFGWVIFVLGLSVGIAFANRDRESPMYPNSLFNSPTKLWHDLLVVPTLTFALLFPLPALFYVPFGAYHLIAGVAFVVWLVLMSEPGSAKKRYTSHVGYDWTKKVTTSARN